MDIDCDPYCKFRGNAAFWLIPWSCNRTERMSTVGQTTVVSRSDANLADIIFMMSVNFLLYVVLIIVFYMLVRFYLEEEVEINEREGYARVSTKDDDDHSKESASQPTGEDAPKSKINVESLEPPARVRRTSSFLNINEWGEPEGTKQEVLQKLLICAVGLIICFSIWGLVQERMLTQTYNGDYFEYSYGLVFMNRLGGLVLSWFLMYYFKVDWVSSALWEYSFPSVANMLSSWCQYEALKYVSFPVTMLAKAFKMVPVMLMGYFMNNKSYESYEYLSGALVGLGLYLFLDSSEHLDFQQNVFGHPETVRGAMCGVVLLILFLFFDSFTGQWQTRMFQLNKAMSPLQMMLIMNAFSAVFSFITLVHQEELVPSLWFVYEHPHMILHLVIFCVCSTVGQLFIFYTVKNFGAVVFAIIMSVRILCSTLLSCVVYSHPISELGYLGIIIVFGAITYRIKRKTEGTTLIRWKESPPQDSTILKEWHEHLDI